MARKNSKPTKPRASVCGPLEKAGFSVGWAGGGLLLWGRRLDPESDSSEPDVLISCDDGDFIEGFQGVDGDPSKENWTVGRRDAEDGEGFVEINGLRLDEAIELAFRLPDPKGRQVGTFTAGAERSPEEALELAVAMASDRRNSL